MFSKLARSTGLVILATCVATAPVLGSVPRCCNTGAIAHGGNCCCGPKEQQEKAAAVEIEKPCCAKEHKSCCAEPAAAPEPQTASSNCCCKSFGAMVVATDGTDRLKLREKSAPSALSLEPNTSSAESATAAAPGVSRPGPMKLPLQQLYCRWTV